MVNWGVLIVSFMVYWGVLLVSPGILGSTGGSNYRYFGEYWLNLLVYWVVLIVSHGILGSTDSISWYTGEY